MTDLSKIKPSHTARAAYIYIRQSTPVPGRTQPRIHSAPVRAGRQSLPTRLAEGAGRHH